MSTCKYRHIVLKGTNFKKLKSYQFFFKGNVKRLESKIHEDKTCVKSQCFAIDEKSPYRVVVEFTPQCDVSRAACTCPAELGSKGKGKCNHIGGVLFALEYFTRRVYKNILNHYRAHRVFRYGWFHAIRALQPSPLIKS